MKAARQGPGTVRNGRAAILRALRLSWLWAIAVAPALPARSQDGPPFVARMDGGHLSVLVSRPVAAAPLIAALAERMQVQIELKGELGDIGPLRFDQLSPAEALARIVGSGAAVVAVYGADDEGATVLRKVVVMRSLANPAATTAIENSPGDRAIQPRRPSSLRPQVAPPPPPPSRALIMRLPSAGRS